MPFFLLHLFLLLLFGGLRGIIDFLLACLLVCLFACLLSCFVLFCYVFFLFMGEEGACVFVVAFWGVKGDY